MGPCRWEVDVLHAGHGRERELVAQDGERLGIEHTEQVVPVFVVGREAAGEDEVKVEDLSAGELLPGVSEDGTVGGETLVRVTVSDERESFGLEQRGEVVFQRLLRRQGYLRGKEQEERRAQCQRTVERPNEVHDDAHLGR